MKILQIAPYFIPYMGGQETFVYNLSKHLINNGHEVHVITSNFPNTQKCEEIDGITIERFDILMKPLRNPISLDFLKIQEKISEFDVVHLHNEHSFPAMITAYFKSKNDFPLILTNHGQLEFGSTIKDTCVKAYSKLVSKRILEQCNVVTVLSESQKKFLSSINQNIYNRIEIIPNAIDIEFLKKLDESKHVKTESEFKILYVGQLIKRKGLEWLIKSINAVRYEYPNIKLILVGEGEDEAYFKKLVCELKLDDFIEFKGKINDQKVLVSIYKIADIFVLPSLSEGLPTVLLEALFFGLPVIATDIPGIKDHFENYVSLIPPKDSDKLAEAIINLSKKDKLEQAKKLSKEFMSLIEINYSWTAITEKYERIYEDILIQKHELNKIHDLYTETNELYVK